MCIGTVTSHRGEQRGNVRGQERRPRRNRAATLQRQHHRGLQTPHMLRRDSAENGAAARKWQPRTQCLRPCDERAPALRMRTRRAGRTRREQGDRRLFRGDRGISIAFRGLGPVAQIDLVYPAKRIRSINESVCGCVHGCQVTQGGPGSRGRQQAHRTPQQRGRQPEREVQAVLAKIDAISARGHSLRERLRGSDESLDVHPPSGTPPDGRARRKVRHQRERDRIHL
jgi:hypothetical protein